MSKHATRGGILDGLTENGFIGSEKVQHVESVEKRSGHEMRPSASISGASLEGGESVEPVHHDEVDDGRKQIEWMYNKDYDKTNEESLEEYLVGKKSIDKLMKGGDLIDNDYKTMQEQKMAGALFLHSHEHKHHEDTSTNDPMMKIKHESLMRMKMYLQNPELLQKELEKRKKEKKKKEKKEKKEKKKDKKDKKEKKEKKEKKKDKKRKDYSSDSSYTSYSSDEPKEKKKKVDIKSSETNMKEAITAPISQPEKESSTSSAHKKEYHDDKYYRNDRNYDRDYERDDRRYRGGNNYRDYDERRYNDRSYRRDYDERYYDERDYDERRYNDRNNSRYRDFDDRYDRRDYEKGSSKKDNVYSKEDSQKQLDQMLKNGQQREQQKQESKLKSLQEKEDILNTAPQSIHNEKATFLQQTRKDTYMNKSFNKR